MPDRNPAALDFLLTRRSRPAKTLVPPVPDRAALTEILTAAARTPDHGKLEPWRFIVLGRSALTRIADGIAAHAARAGYDAEKAAKGQSQFRDGHLAVVVVAAPKPSEKVPPIEQSYSAGAVCLALLNAALAAGWGANWLSGWPSHEPGLMQDLLGLDASESVAGIIHIGTETSAPPERPRPDLATLVTWDET